MKKYENLKKQYPEYISLDQLHRICHIAKRSARYLVEKGIIPATDTGRTTWRRKIAIDDVIVYLQQRDKSGSMIPTGAVNSKKPRAIGGWNGIKGARKNSVEQGGGRRRAGARQGRQQCSHAIFTAKLVLFYSLIALVIAHAGRTHKKTGGASSCLFAISPFKPA